MKNAFLIFLSIFFSSKMFATTQRPDLLIVGKDTLELREMNTFPLEYLNMKSRPFNYTRQTAPGTACWRGYQAIWHIIDHKIYLEAILRCDGDDNSERSENLTDIFKRNKIEVVEKNGMILASWIDMELYELTGLHAKPGDRRTILSDVRAGKKTKQKTGPLMIIQNGEVVSSTVK